MQHGRDTIRVEMRDHQGRVTAILDEIAAESETDYQRLAKRAFLNFQAAQGPPPTAAMSWQEIARSAVTRVDSCSWKPDKASFRGRPPGPGFGRPDGALPLKARG
jgi:hypothetical protein